MNTKRLTKLVALVLVLVMALATLAACGPEETTTTTTTTTNNTPIYKWEDDGKMYTYNTFTTLSPSNWNELTYQDNNDTQIMGYLGSSFFTYNFRFDENGEIIPGDFVTEYSAATKLEDVTAEYKDAWSLPGDKGYAYKITLREDLKWENGDPIVAGDFVYTMKEQLNPLFQHYRADSYYAGSVNLVGAKAYAKQGQSGLFSANEPYSVYSEDLDSVLVWTMGPAVADDTATPENEAKPTSYIRKAYFEPNVGMPANYSLEKTAAFLAGNFGGDAATYVAMEGKTLAEIKADEAMKACYEAVLGWWQTEPNEELHLFTTNYTFPEASWDNVGILAPSKYEIVVILTNPLELLKEDGSLSYMAAYNMSSLPLVHKATWEANIVDPVEGSTLYTTTYHTSKESTMSWGPYKLTSFQSGKQYIIDRNLNWYGYNMEEYAGQYLTDRIVCDTIKEYNSALVQFLAGEIDGIGISVAVADLYKNSDRAYYTPSDYVGSLQLQSNTASLKTRGDEQGVNKMLLGYTDFRKALSLAINRAEYTKACTTAYLQGFGIFNSMHYYDVENGKAYRESDEAKKVLCDVYGVNPDDFDSLDDAVDSITGYDLEQARALVNKAYAEALEAGDITANDKVKFTFGTGAINENVQRHFDYLSAAWIKLVETTPLEGRVEFELKDFATKWADDFRAGAYDICMGGWTGAAWNPGYFLLAYLSPDYMYSQSWDTSATYMEFTMVGCGENGEDITDTLSLMEWYNCLNGATDAPYDFSSTALTEAQRLPLIAALEKEILTVYYTIPTSYEFGASLLSYKVDYITYEYNTFMSYGGMRYMTYNYTDEEWAAAVAEQNGQLEY